MDDLQTQTGIIRDYLFSQRAIDQASGQVGCVALQILELADLERTFVGGA